MILIIGLGNPGEKYKKTRHNVGFIVLDKILDKIDWSKSSKAKTLFYQDTIVGETVEYLKPQTFMNDSGFSVSYTQKKHEIKSEDIIVIHDDLDLPFNKIKISYDRGDGGHNGIKSIMNYLGSQSFIRIRVGISILDENGILRKPNVLSQFSKKEINILEKNISPTIKEILETIIKNDKETAMNKYNTI